MTTSVDLSSVGGIEPVHRRGDDDATGSENQPAEKSADGATGTRAAEEAGSLEHGAPAREAAGRAAPRGSDDQTGDGHRPNSAGEKPSGDGEKETLAKPPGETSGGSEGGDDGGAPDGPLTPMERWERAEDRLIDENIAALREHQQLLREQGNEEGAQAEEDFIARLRSQTGGENRGRSADSEVDVHRERAERTQEGSPPREGQEQQAGSPDAAGEASRTEAPSESPAQDVSRAPDTGGGRPEEMTTSVDLSSVGGIEPVHRRGDDDATGSENQPAEKSADGATGTRAAEEAGSLEHGAPAREAAGRAAPRGSDDQTGDGHRPNSAGEKPSGDGEKETLAKPPGETSGGSEGGDDGGAPDGPLTPMERWERAEDRLIDENIAALREHQQLLREQGNEEGAQAEEDFIARLRSQTGGENRGRSADSEVDVHRERAERTQEGSPPREGQEQQAGNHDAAQHAEATGERKSSSDLSDQAELATKADLVALEEKTDKLRAAINEQRSDQPPSPDALVARFTRTHPGIGRPIEYILVGATVLEGASKVVDGVHRVQSLVHAHPAILDAVGHFGQELLHHLRP